MLFVDGLLAAWDGVLIASYKFWCECVRGGECCGGECQCGEGECCGGEWYEEGEPGECCLDVWYTEAGQCCSNGWFADDYECPEGTVFSDDIDNITGEPACGCVDEELDCEHGLYQDETGIYCKEFPDDPDNPGTNVKGSCCIEGEACQTVFQSECAGDWYTGSCVERGCPVPCCTENDDGSVTCEEVLPADCDGVIDSLAGNCDDACTGECCIDCLTPSEDSPITQAECDAIGGSWMGISSVGCYQLAGQCRAPFDEDCCESVVSNASRLTFTGPRKKRCPEFDPCGFIVQVTVQTARPVYVHGGLFGSPYETCTDETLIGMCNDQFYVTPAPCEGVLRDLDIKVCWLDVPSFDGPELLRFHCCQNVTHLLGNCECDCVTRLLYEGDGCTTNANLQILGDAIIESNGIGPLVITGSITNLKACDRLLTLTGSNVHENEITSVIPNATGGDLSVTKSGTGTWKFGAAHSYEGKFLVLDGTAITAASVPSSGASPWGAPSLSANFSQFFSTLLLTDGVAISRQFGLIGTLGGIGAGTSEIKIAITVRLYGTTTFQAEAGHTLILRNEWRDADGNIDPVVSIVFGAAGQTGTVEARSFFPDSIVGASVVSGTLVLAYADSFAGVFGTTPVTAGNVTLKCVAVGGNPQAIADLRVDGACVADVDAGVVMLVTTLSGSGSIEKTGAGELRIAGTNTMTGPLSVQDGLVVIGGDFGSTPIVIGDATVEFIDVGQTLADLSATGASTVEIDSGLSVSVVNLSGSGSIEKTGAGELRIAGTNTMTGEVDVQAGSVVVETLVSGPAKFSEATFTDTALTVTFSSAPASGEEYKLLAGPSAQTYATPSLVGAGAATATWNPATSTLTID